MVCRRCIMAVETVLEKLGHAFLSVELGEVKLLQPITDKEKAAIATHLKTFGFELIDDKNTQLISQVKTLIIDLIYHKDNDLNINLSEYLSQNLAQDYSSISNLFSEIEGTTIEKYFIHQKIERVKELLVYDEMSLSEIAFSLNYSSVGYLSNQFKKITGLTPTHFRQLKDKKRKQIEDL